MTGHGKIVVMVFALFLSVFFSLTTAWSQPFKLSSPEQEEPRYQVLSSEGGRYTFGQVSGSDKDKFMLDTLTGRLWRIAESGKVGIYLMPVKYRIGDGEYSDLPGDNQDSRKGGRKDKK